MPEPPEPGPDEVTVRVRALGLCGTDLHFYLEGASAGRAVSYPCVLGHEAAGAVVAAGKNVQAIAAGTRVAVEPTITCGECEFCLAGRRNLCEHAVFMGGLQQPGLLRELATMPARNVVTIPDGMSYAAATLIEPLAVILHAFELTPVEPGQTVAVMGAGPIGLLSAAVARLSGAGRVVVADRIAHRLNLALEMGADTVVDISRELVADAILDITGGRGAHLIVDAAGRPDSLTQALWALAPGGRIALIGIPSESSMSVDIQAALTREATLVVVRRSNQNDYAALGLIASGKIRAEMLVTHRFALDQTDHAFQVLAGYADGVAKAVVEL